MICLLPLRIYCGGALLVVATGGAVCISALSFSLSTGGAVCITASPRYVCEELGAMKDDYLEQEQVNSILTAVAQGMRREEANASVRLAATTALFNALEFAHTNFDNEQERNYLMQVRVALCICLCCVCPPGEHWVERWQMQRTGLTCQPIVSCHLRSFVRGRCLQRPHFGKPAWSVWSKLPPTTMRSFLSTCSTSLTLRSALSRIPRRTWHCRQSSFGAPSVRRRLT